MPIEEIDLAAGTVSRTCGKCGATDKIPIADLKAGVGMKKRPVPDTIRAPNCSGCGAGEQWRRTFDAIEDYGSLTEKELAKYHKGGHAKRRKVVNALFAHLISEKLVDAKCAAIYAKETAKPREVADLTKDEERKIPLPDKTAAIKLARKKKT